MVVIDASGKNSFGGITRDDTVLVYIPFTGEIIIDLEGYAKQLEQHSVGTKKIKAIDLQNEALTFEINKTNYTYYDAHQLGY